MALELTLSVKIIIINRNSQKNLFYKIWKLRDLFSNIKSLSTFIEKEINKNSNDPKIDHSKFDQTWFEKITLKIKYFFPLIRVNL